MTAGELCVRDVVTATANETVTEAARRMAAFHVGDLIVVEDRPGRLPRPIGVITDRDLVVKVLARPDRAASTTTIAEVMSRDIITANETDDVEHVIEQMRENAIRRIPIVDEEDGLQGVLAIDDVVGWMRDQIQAATRILERQSQGPRTGA
jgi:CBS domain-containing protein